jgi:hypothetical protein
LVTDYVSALAAAIRDEVPVGARPHHSDEFRLFRIYAVLALSKGEGTSAEDVHNAWCAWMGDIDPGHPALRPYAELSSDERKQDEPFTRAIQSLASRLPR